MSGNSRQNSDDRSLETYRNMRDAGTTPEPFGKTGSRPYAFVVQKHGARRLHYDFRLEWRGVLLSWAVPKGPSPNPSDKRFAAQTEDHPVDYVDFEGIIPDGNYGAGPVIVWDKGTWVPLEDPDEGLEKGKLLFDLHGYKLRGRWTLVRIKSKDAKRSGKDWLLIKEHDVYARDDGDAIYLQSSVLSGLSLQERGEGHRRKEDALAELDALGAPKKKVLAKDVKPMLAEASEQAFSDDDWIFELKYDGFRLRAGRAQAVCGGEPRLYYRHGSDSTVIFPEIVTALAALPVDSYVLDGEVVVLDEKGHPSFSRLQKRAQLRRALDIERMSVNSPATFFVFDLLALEGHDLRKLPLVARKVLLQKILPPAGPLRYADHIVGQGEGFYDEVTKMGLEGTLAKRADSPYVSRRSGHWKKVKATKTGDFAIVGFSKPKAGRVALGALHLATCDDGERFVVAGRVGTGMSDDQLREIRERLDEDRTDSPAVSGNLPKSSNTVWVVPKYVCEVRFASVTDAGQLRHPVFVRMRDDKAPNECTPRGHGAPKERQPPEPNVAAAPHDVPFTNLTKVFWPDDKFTKGDLIEYYRSVSPWLLPYLRDRPLVMTRFPDGIDGKSFFQKNAPEWTPSWLRTERMWSERASREVDYFVCDTVESLLYVANMGTIPLHVWASRVGDLAKPDWCILDLDPKDAPFSSVIKTANTIRKLCADIELPCYPKTSGQAGLHVLIPLGQQLTFEQCKQLSELLARLVADKIPDIATTARTISKRHGRVYIDFLQNGHGKLLAAPLCVRPRPGAPVSTPLLWREVNARLDPSKFTIRTVPQRLARLGDPLAQVLTDKPNLVAALEQLAQQPVQDRRS